MLEATEAIRKRKERQLSEICTERISGKQEPSVAPLHQVAASSRMPVKLVVSS